MVALVLAFLFWKNDYKISFHREEVDAFGRLRTSLPYTLFQNTQIDGIDNFGMDQKTSGASITHMPDSSVDLKITTPGSNYAIYQSREYIPYQPGKSHLIMLTGVLDSGNNDTSTITRLGYYDSENGIFFERYDGKLCVVRRSSVTGSVVDTRIFQRDFNLNKVSDLRMDRTQIFFVDLEWLGVGTVSCGFVRDRKLVYTHQFHHDNREITTYMNTATLPVRYEIIGSSGSMKAICSTVISEGGFQTLGRPFTASSGLVTITSAETPLLAIRLKSQFKRTNVLVLGYDIGNKTVNADGVHYRLRHYLSPTTDPLTGGTWTSADTNSYTEYRIPTSFSDAGSAVVMSSFTSKKTNESTHAHEERKINLTFDIDGNYGDIVLLTGESLNADVEASSSLHWTEIR